MQLRPKTLFLFITLTITLFAMALPLPAEIVQGHDLRKKKQQIEQPGEPFSSSDFLRLCMEESPRNSFMLGEPVPLKFRLVNHTKKIVVIQLNLDFRGGLEVKIGDGRRPPRRYLGPYPAGEYPPLEMKLYPLEERPFQILLWGDLDSPSGMAFPEPGQYAIDFKVRIKVPDANIEADMFPLDPITLAPEKSWKINVRAPSAVEAPLVDELKSSGAFKELHVRHLPGEDVQKFTELIQKYPATPLTPYLSFVLGLHLNLLSIGNPKDTSLMSQSSQHLQMAGLADSAIKLDAWEALIHLYDRWGLATPAQETIIRFIRETPRTGAPMIGNMPVVKKYIPNSTEMDRTVYWDLLN